MPSAAEVALDCFLIEHVENTEKTWENMVHVILAVSIFTPLPIRPQQIRYTNILFRTGERMSRCQSIDPSFRYIWQLAYSHTQKIKLHFIDTR
jgi:hypothetical protein